MEVTGEFLKEKQCGVVISRFARKKVDYAWVASIGRNRPAEHNEAVT